MSHRSVRSLFPAPVLVAGGVLVAATAYLTWLASRLWFVQDDWSFLLHRSVTGPADLPLLEAHSDHWVTLPILVYRSLFGVFGMHHYLPYALVNIALHVVVCVLLAVLLRRTGADAWVCVLALTSMAFMGPGALDILWDFQMTLLGPVALGLAALLVVDSDEEPRRLPWAAWGLLVLALMCSGTGVVMVAFVATYTLMRRGLRAALTVAVLPAAVFLAWYVPYGRTDTSIPTVPLGRILPFVLKGTTNLWYAVIPVPGLGVAVLLAGILAAVFGRNLPPRLRMLAAAGLAALAFDYLLLAVTRGGRGLDAALLARYLYPALVLTLPAVAAVLQVVWSALSRLALLRTGVWICLALLVTTFGVADFHRMGVQLRDDARGLPARAVAASAMVQRGDRLLSDEVDRENAPDLDTAALGRADVRRALPDLVPGPQAVLDTAANLKVGVSTEPLAVAPASCPAGGGPGTVVLAPSGPGGGQVRLAVSGHHLVTSLTVGDRRSAEVTWDVQPGVPVYVGTTQGNASLRVVVPRGSVRSCSDGGSDD